ncbi:hypothetical protein QCE63_20095 [Caballeronia sp. LZ065]|uniref:hypothetical protein n=1 Tax=Caballeronia sp. LZ065 TaxID=3038571 RepID=UPI00285CB097|nr:hypothetical protein [Caballeronia sp. LZ065]MDR5781703.1 hypothetical protein [Caballeronia sp. LZ065]
MSAINSVYPPTAKRHVVIEVIFSILIFLFVTFYWIGKEPGSFVGVSFPYDISYVVIGIGTLCGVLSFIQGRLTFSTKQLAFIGLLILAPFPGLFGMIFAHPELSEWRNYIGKDMVRNTYLGFRPVTMQAGMFLFCAPMFARFLGRPMLIAITLAVGLHIVWGLAQVLYPINEHLIDRLPIVAVGPCSAGGDCRRTVRAVGLMPNPFFFSFLLFSYAALFIRRWDGWQGKIGLILSCLSISRSFMIAASIVLLSRLTWRNILLIVVLVIGPLYLASNIVMPIWDARISGDISYESRSSTNALALEEFFVNGNLFGLGFEPRYYTDSTLASLLLGGGLASVVIYVVAWLFLFSSWRESVEPKERRIVVAFTVAFFVSQMLVGGADAQPGELLFFIAYWRAYLDAAESHNNDMAHAAADIQ